MEKKVHATIDLPEQPCVVVSRMPEEEEATAFVFDLLDHAIATDTSEILITPIQSVEQVRIDFCRNGCFYGEAPLTRQQFGYVAIHLIHLANPGEQPQSERKLFHSADGQLYILRFWKVRLPDLSTAISIRIDLAELDLALLTTPA